MKNLNFRDVKTSKEDKLVRKEFSYEKIKIEGLEDLPVEIFETLHSWDVYTIVESGKVIGIEAYAHNTITALRKLKLGNLLLANAKDKI